MAALRLLMEKAEDLREMERGAIANHARLVSLLGNFGKPLPRPRRGG